MNILAVPHPQGASACADAQANLAVGAITFLKEDNNKKTRNQQQQQFLHCMMDVDGLSLIMKAKTPPKRTQTQKDLR